MKLIHVVLIFSLYKAALGKCATGTYLVNTECILCMNGCDDCTQANECTTCSPNFYWNGLSCVCKNGRILNTSGKCVTCTDNCYTCKDETTCEICKNGSNCPTCTNGYFLNNGICYECLTNCLNCINSTSCTTCNSENNLNDTGNQCSMNCGTGFYELNGSCTVCSNNCLECSNGDSCSECSKGLLWDTSSKSCILVQNCSSSQYYSNEACHSCLANCASCVSGTSCEVCTQLNNQMTIYVSSQESCLTCDSLFGVCESCDANTCLNRCPTGYVYEKEQCKTKSWLERIPKGWLLVLVGVIVFLLSFSFLSCLVALWKTLNPSIRRFQYKSSNSDQNKGNKQLLNKNEPGSQRGVGQKMNRQNLNTMPQNPQILQNMYRPPQSQIVRVFGAQNQTVLVRAVDRSQMDKMSSRGRVPIIKRRSPEKELNKQPELSSSSGGTDREFSPSYYLHSGQMNNIPLQIMHSESAMSHQPQSNMFFPDKYI